MIPAARRLYARAALTVELVLFLLLGSCGRVTVGPFYPADPVVCAGPADCSSREVCKFPAVDTKAICMPLAGGVGGDWDGVP